VPAIENTENLYTAAENKMRIRGSHKFQSSGLLVNVGENTIYSENEIIVEHTTHEKKTLQPGRYEIFMTADED